MLKTHSKDSGPFGSVRVCRSCKFLGWSRYFPLGNPKGVENLGFRVYVSPSYSKDFSFSNLEGWITRITRNLIVKVLLAKPQTRDHILAVKAAIFYQMLVAEVEIHPTSCLFGQQPKLVWTQVELLSNIQVDLSEWARIILWHKWRFFRLWSLY